MSSDSWYSGLTNWMTGGKNQSYSPVIGKMGNNGMISNGSGSYDATGNLNMDNGFDWGGGFDTLGKWGGLATGAFDAFNGWQQNNLMEDNMNFQQGAWNKQYAQSMREYNEYQDKLDVGRYGSVAAANTARAGDQTRTSKYGNVS